MWIKDASSGKIYAAKKLRLADPSLLIAYAPLGATVVPMAFWNKCGLYEAAPVLVSPETNAFTPGYQEGRSLVQ